jgi:hypothetical protein
MPGISHIKLFHYPATRSARVRWALHETVGDDFEIEGERALHLRRQFFRR